MATMLPLDAGHSIAPAELGTSMYCINDDEHRIDVHIFYTDTRKQTHTIAYKTPS